MPSPDEVFNEQQALKNLGGNQALFLKMAQYFLSYSEELLQPMRVAKNASDWPRLRETNHKLMGSVCTFGGNKALDATRQLEHSIDHGHVARLNQDFAAVEEATCQLNAAFRARLDLPH